MKPRPHLVALDFQQGKATRYIPKPTDGFLTDNATLPTPEVGYGGDAGLELIEDFRTGKTPGTTQVPQPQQEQQA